MRPLPAHLIGLAWEAAFDRDAEGWRAFVESLSCALGRNAVAMTVRLHDGTLFGLGATHSDPTFQASYVAHYAALDPWEPLMARLPVGVVGWGHSLVDPNEVIRGEFYNDWLSPQGLSARTTLGATLIRTDDGGLAGALGVLEGHGKRPLTEEDRKLLEGTVPQLAYAARATREILSARLQTTRLHGVLDSLRAGVVVTDRNGRVLATNEEGERLLVEGTGLRKDRGLLAASDRDSTPRLRASIGRAAGAPGTPPSASSLRLHRPRHEASLSLFVMPLPNASGAHPGSVLVLVSDEAAPPVLLGRALRESYGLTPAESRLAESLARGATLEEIAERFRITRNTARAQLRSTFDKVGVTRQAELVRTVLALPAAAVDLRETDGDGTPPAPPASAQENGANGRSPAELTGRRRPRDPNR